MHLTPEQRAIGKENFHGAIGSEFTRRDFLKGSLAAGVAAGAGGGAYYFAYNKVNDPVRIGVIGTGDEGGVLIGAHNPAYTKIVAIADIRPYNIHRAFHGDESSAGALAARPGLLAKYGWKSEDKAREQIKVYDQDYHDLLNDPDVEGVVIALPLHLHALVAIEALRAGKHVLTEKLMAHSIHECKEMARVAYDQKLLLATGHQRHYSILYDNAVDTLRRRLVGDIHHIRAQWHRGPDSWKFPLPQDMPKTIEDRTKALEAELALPSPDRKRVRDIELQIKIAKLRMLDRDVKPEEYGYLEKQLTQDGNVVYTCSPMEELIRWRLWDRTGGGLMAELGSHQLDASSIFISSMYDEVQNEFGKMERAKVMPLSVTAVGGRHIYKYDRDVDDHVYCIFEFPAPGYYKDNDLEKREIADPNKKIVVTYSSISGNGFGDYGEIVMGTTGTLILEREQEVMLFGTSTNTKVSVAKKGNAAPVLQAAESPSSAAVATGKEGTGGDGPISRGYMEEMEHWAWCIRNSAPENRPKCHPKVAMADAIIALVSNMAIKDQKRIDFKPEWFDISSDETPEDVKPDLTRYKA